MGIPLAGEVILVSAFTRIPRMTRSSFKQTSKPMKYYVLRSRRGTEPAVPYFLENLPIEEVAKAWIVKILGGLKDTVHILRELREGSNPVGGWEQTSIQEPVDTCVRLFSQRFQGASR